MNELSESGDIYDLVQIKDDVIDLMLICGDRLRRGFSDVDKQVTTKLHANDFLTKYDTEINERIMEYLLKKYPEIGIISEESVPIGEECEYTFLVDPIDGTRNFKKAIPIFFIGIALQKNNETVLSMTYNPMTQEMYWAIKGEGAYLNGDRINASEAIFKHSDISISFRKNPAVQLDMTRRIVNEIYGIRNNSCVHHDLAFIARGTLDGMVHSGAQIWDYCHYLLVKEAGGIVTDWDGNT